MTANETSHGLISGEGLRSSCGSGLPDIKPKTQVVTLEREKYTDLRQEFPINRVAVAVGMSNTFIRRVVGRKEILTVPDVLALLDQDSYKETIVPRSRVIDFLQEKSADSGHSEQVINRPNDITLLKGHALDLLATVPRRSVQCVVTSTPYWGMRLYSETYVATWADGEKAAYGHEQTPEGFVRHTIEVLAALHDVLTPEGSIWWNIMDTFNTRTQIRNSAVEALHAMQGRKQKSWNNQECRRYSAGHSYLKDGEQCMIPSMIAERASRIGYYVKSVITWAKTSTLPEPQESRVSRNLEYVLHLSKVRKPFFQKEVYRELPSKLGGRNSGWETDKLSDIWSLPTSTGGDGHGAQFPISLPARCIALTTKVGDLVLDPFVGAGNSALAAQALERRLLGFDVSQEYLNTANRRLGEVRLPNAENLQSKFLNNPRQEIFSGF